jgi:hypothetical protein
MERLYCWENDIKWKHLWKKMKVPVTCKFCNDWPGQPSCIGRSLSPYFLLPADIWQDHDSWKNKHRQTLKNENDITSLLVMVHFRFHKHCKSAERTLRAANLPVNRSVHLLNINGGPSELWMCGPRWKQCWSASSVSLAPSTLSKSQNWPLLIRYSKWRFQQGLLMLWRASMESCGDIIYCLWTMTVHMHILSFECPGFSKKIWFVTIADWPSLMEAKTGYLTINCEWNLTYLSKHKIDGFSRCLLIISIVM